MGKIRTAGPDYLAYALIDAVVDSYFPVLETYGERLDLLEDEVLEIADRSVMDRLHEVKADLLVLRRAIGRRRSGGNSLVIRTSELRKPPRFICETATITLCKLSSWWRPIANSRRICAICTCLR